ncbi:activity-dependent neuroprotector homeobox protein 2 [Stegostoma tigrinum]|uniref:activity-dependent neuroprotector homeobox protein 2 n=1 Tax=Stegostoma tigrinum TaxID=3053191 RepID=UPI00202B73D4|nr:activity-dependent neuroprotector homeobox protein 2 [Stegostoma tigrinum]XP_048375770.1 activity-dependent neuroprotector homeobox protein 2 [Stegostoma tigrinum]XP_048375781.1 activity-dependent neuroprotector homeobox protein 2 [Stegostoma tigrinum]XP_048375790.1 activity-dependent neuroprotector homeobox protein 2 [Stegostoma tigrinum]XP_048375797.1 activity-dependent neuroprotector homeobox protein 2 [Stegostoma tigrinum]XP_048375817.1 activity-dependent neuroprotector homeobox protein
MYQLPVTKLETIRKSRKKVKRILSDIGLEYCKELLEEFRSYNPGEYYVKNTTWNDVSVWQPIKRSKAYRTKPYCCSLCNFSTKFISAYKSHMRCSHEDEMDVELMASCPNCTFISHPKSMKKHVKIFHSDSRKVHNTVNHVNTDQIRQIQPKMFQGKMSTLVQPVYFCRVCSYKEVSLYAMKKHVFLSHFGNLVNNYIGEVEEPVLLSVYKYFCKGCQMKMVTYDAFLYHILDRHKEVEGPVKATIGHMAELSPRLHIAPKAQVSSVSLPVLPSVGSAVPSLNTKLTGHMLSCVKTASPAHSIRPVGPVLSSVKSTANITLPVPSTSCVRSPVTAAVQQAVNILTLPQNIKPVALGSLRPSMSSFPLQNNVIPVTVPTAGPGDFSKPAHVNLVSATFQVTQNNFTIQAVSPVLPQAFLMPQGLTVDHTAGANVPRNALPSNSQTVRHLIQSNKHINGVPAYTLTPVQFSLPVTPGSILSNKPAMISTTQVPLNISQTNTFTSVSQQQTKELPTEITVMSAVGEQKQSAVESAAAVDYSSQNIKAQQWKSCSVCSALLPLSAYDNHVATAHKIEEYSDKPEKIVACATYLQRVRAQTSKCLFCRSYMDKNVLMSHLLMHGLTCLFCSLTFHDLPKLSEHVKALHAGLRFEAVENVKDGVSTVCEINGGSFNLTVKLPEAEMGPNDIHLTLIPNKMSTPHAPLVIEVCRQKEEINMEETVIEVPQSSKCPFCSKHLSSTTYENHLQEDHHVAPMVHPLLRIPAFKCIHCLGVYTDSMTTSTISLHLLRCRGLNKQQSNMLSKSVQSKCEFPETAKYNNELTNGDKIDLVLPPPKRIKADAIANNFDISPVAVTDSANTKHSPPLSDPSAVLALVPKGFEDRSYEERKLFLLDYFHKQPYPSNKEIEMLSSILWLWKNDVAFVFGNKQRLCLKAMKYKPSVLLGFNMTELRKVKHNLKLGDLDTNI